MVRKHRRCCVNGCKGGRVKGISDPEEISFYRIPAIIRNQGERTLKLSQERRALWIRNLRLKVENVCSDKMRVCSKHFIAGVPSKLFEQTDPDWVPSKCLESIFSETFNEVEERKFESKLNMEDDQEEMPVIIAGETFMWEGKEMPVIIPGETPIPEENKIPSESLVTVKIEMPELTTSSESLVSEENKMQFDSPSNNDFLRNTFNVCTRDKNSQGTQTDYYDLENENRNLRIMILQLEENLKQLRMQKT